MQHISASLVIALLACTSACAGGMISNGLDGGSSVDTSGVAGTDSTGNGSGSGNPGTGSGSVNTDSNGSSGPVVNLDGHESWVWVYANWQTSLDTIAANSKSFTHISPTFYSINYNYTGGVPYYANCPTSSGTLNCTAQGSNNFDGLTTAQFTTKAKAAGMQVVPAIYAGAGNNGTDAAVVSILNNTNNAGTNFINALVTEAVNNGYNGYNLDWEVGSSVGSAYSDKFVSFANTFQKALAAHNMSLSVDAIGSNVNGNWCSGNDGYLDFAKLAKSSIDRVIIEDYTETLGNVTSTCQQTTLSSTTPASCPLNSSGTDVTVVGLLDFMCGNLPPNMVVIGFESYSTATNPIAGSAMAAAKNYGFTKVAIWPQIETGYPFLSGKNLVAPQSDWYKMLATFMTP